MPNHRHPPNHASPPRSRLRALTIAFTIGQELLSRIGPERQSTRQGTSLVVALGQRAAVGDLLAAMNSGPMIQSKRER